MAKLTERQLEVKRRYRENNRELVRTQERERQFSKRRLEPEKYILANCKSRAKRESLPFNLELSDIQIPTHCPVLNIKLKHNFGGRTPANNSPSLDKLVPELGYVKGNVFIISHRANRLKSDLTIAEIGKLWAYVNGKH